MQVKEARLKSGKVSPKYGARTIGGTILDVNNAERIAAIMTGQATPAPSPSPKPGVQL
jgi:hypothetical protein